MNPAERETQQKAASPGEKESSNPAAPYENGRGAWPYFTGGGVKRIIFEGSNIGSYIRPQEERPPFGFKLSETRAKTNGPSLGHLAPAGHADADSRRSARYFRAVRAETARFSYYRTQPKVREALRLEENIETRRGILLNMFLRLYHLFSNLLHSQARVIRKKKN